MSQQAFGDLLGVSANTVHLWERKGARPSMSSMVALARVMEIPLDKIMRDSMTDYTDI
jgi:transcriptional regulator with XRE-family HTH domain